MSDRANIMISIYEIIGRYEVRKSKAREHKKNHNDCHLECHVFVGLTGRVKELEDIIRSNNGGSLII